MLRVSLCTDVAYPGMGVEMQEEGEEISNFVLVETLQGIIIWFEVLLNSQIIEASMSKY